jgi:hypothetical protein
MFADLVSVAGHLYKFGLNDGLPGNSEKPLPINLHCDEFNELMGEEFIPLVNKGGGAGIQVTAYTQTLSDIQARIGSASKAGQVVGNFNNLIMLRVRETATAEQLTKQLPQVEVRPPGQLRRYRYAGRHQQLYQQHPRTGDHPQCTAAGYRRADPASQRLPLPCSKAGSCGKSACRCP